MFPVNVDSQAPRFFRWFSCSHACRAGLFLSIGLLLFPAQAHGQQDVSLSPPLSGAIGEPVYSESVQTGPSSSLVPADRNLTDPYIRNGISDPLDSLIESGSMSPYAPEGSAITSYADAEVLNQVPNDSTVASRFSEYRNNSLLMSGAGNTSLRVGRSTGAGASVSGHSVGRSGAASAAFSQATVLAPFAAGSSALASAQGMGGGPQGFVDPNAVIASAMSSIGQGGDLSGASSTSAAVIGSGAGMSDDASSLSDSTAISASSDLIAAVPVGMLVPPPNSTAIGPAPGDIFPDVSVAAPSMTGFQDSTMGTAGLPYDAEDTTSSSREDAISPEGPFTSMSSEATKFLNPTLLYEAEGDQGEEPAVSLSELKRKARLHALIYNPGAALPSPFEERAMEKAYLRQKSGGHVSHYPRLTAPSITP